MKPTPPPLTFSEVNIYLARAAALVRGHQQTLAACERMLAAMKRSHRIRDWHIRSEGAKIIHWSVLFNDGRDAIVGTNVRPELPCTH